MNTISRDLLLTFLNEVSNAACRCNMSEILGGHHFDCRIPQLELTFARLKEQLETDPTLLQAEPL